MDVFILMAVCVCVGVGCSGKTGGSFAGFYLLFLVLNKKIKLFSPQHPSQLLPLAVIDAAQKLIFLFNSPFMGDEGLLRHLVFTWNLGKTNPLMLQLYLNFLRS